MANLKGYLKDVNNNIIYENDYDTGWIDIPLVSGVSASFSKIRRVGNLVELAVINCTGWKYNQNIITIPSGFRPTIQSSNSSFRFCCPSTGDKWARAEINSGGGLLQMFNGTCAAGSWVDIHQCWFIG